MSSNDLEFKIITVGDSMVGKTAILKQFVYNQFQELELSTTGIAKSIKTVKLNNGKEMKLKLIDTSGQEKYRSMARAYFKNADGILFVFAYNDENSFNNIQFWINKFNENATKIDIPKLLLGNKNDLEKKVNQETIDNFAKENDIKFFSTSAKDYSSIEVAFKELSEMLYEDYIKEDKGNKKQKQVKIAGKDNDCSISKC